MFGFLIYNNWAVEFVVVEKILLKYSQHMNATIVGIFKSLLKSEGMELISPYIWS
jgi:hypothetical protein